jgi:hypothetical protein
MQRSIEDRDIERVGRWPHPFDQAAVPNLQGTAVLSIAEPAMPMLGVSAPFKPNSDWHARSARWQTHYPAQQPRKRIVARPYLGKALPDLVVILVMYRAQAGREAIDRGTEQPPE